MAFNGLLKRAAETYRLHYDDLIKDSPDVNAALTRLAPETLQSRNRRLKIAFDLSMKGKRLPRESWPTEQEDQPYLRKHIDDVIRERKERAAFRK
ncbi:cytochrome b-c1 complex subunit 7-like isoform 2 [Planoprotostelium fungivorum]|uniref:Cytochrome b-c1 complex subunit 7-like isoform 2 n=1 Tax=Planoprotostelium fungivorum TaxID=1890364 RepID=A0A2P6NCY9_9EUKA|nr:cytochrome b-c1 complex subunit 7-like isoform 2 [Planoprotostelium fungivorum]